METRTQKDESVRRQLLALAGMSRPQLCDKWRDLYGSEPPNSSREFLRSVQLPLAVPGATVVSWGRIVTQFPTYHNAQFIWPVGFK